MQKIIQAIEAAADPTRGEYLPVKIDKIEHSKVLKQIGQVISFNPQASNLFLGFIVSLRNAG